MNQKQLFDRLGAPLSNTRSSRGSVRAQDGVVFLRVWQDEAKQLDGKLFMRVTASPDSEDGETESPGYQERLEHVERVKNGAKTYMVMYRAAGGAAHPRQGGVFNDRELFVGGDVKEVDGEVWVELSERIPVREAMA